MVITRSFGRVPSVGYGQTEVWTIYQAKVANNYVSCLSLWAMEVDREIIKKNFT